MTSVIEPVHLFVYGTLRAGFPAHHVLAGRARAEGTGRIPGRLYDAGRYPAAVASTLPDEWVHGEPFRLAEDDGALLAALDRYEGFLADDPAGSLFRRVAVDVARDDGGAVRAWTYLFNGHVDRLSPIRSGDYADRR